METKQNDEIEIDLRQIAVLLLNKAVIIVSTGVILALIVLLTSKLFIKPLYQSSTSLFVINRQNEGTTTYTDLQSSTQLTKDYKIVVTSRTVTEQVISELDLDMSADQLASSITVETPTDTRILNIFVVNNDQYKAKEIADKVAEISADRICDIMQIEKVNILDEGDVPTSPISPNVKKNTLIGGILGILIACAVVIIRFLLNDTIKDSEDVEKYLGISTLALIPLTEDESEVAKNKKKKKKKTISDNNTRKKGENSGVN